MPNLTPQPRDRVIRTLTRTYGWPFLREGGNHPIYSRADVLEVIVLPRHREISPGVIGNICRILKVPVARFLEMLRNC